MAFHFVEIQAPYLKIFLRNLIVTEHETEKWIAISQWVVCVKHKK